MKNKANSTNYESEDDNIEDDNLNVNDNIEEVQTSESANNNINAEDFNPERVLYDIRKALLGFEKRDGTWVRVCEPLARTEFITLYINSIRSLVNFHNLFSQISAEESAFNMLEGLKEITYAAVDYKIQEEHIETLVNIYDRLMQTFYGIIIDGRGTENVKQVLISAYKDITNLRDMQQNQTGLINFDKLKEYMKT